MKKIKEKLSKLGLKDKEIAVYLAVLSFDKSNISTISQKAGIKRTSSYQYIEDLLKKGFIYKTISGKRLFYSAYNPKKIISYLEQEKRALENKRNNIESIIPELEFLYLKSSKHPDISFLEGKSGLWKAYSEMVDTWNDVYQIFTPENFFKVFSFPENDELLTKLQERGVKLFNFIEKSDKAKERLKIEKYDSFVKNKILPESLKFSSDMLVTGGKLALISFDNQIAVVIKDKAISDMQRDFLKFIWNCL